MGMALVRDLVRRGWKVAVADINENKALVEELGGGASFHKCNVADYDRCVRSESLIRSIAHFSTVKRRCFKAFGISTGVSMRYVPMQASLTKGKAVP